MQPLLDSALPDPQYRGKVRDTYEIDDRHFLMVATDRISAFDVVLPNGVPDKGYVLSRLSRFWFDRTRHIVPNHLVGLADDAAALGDLAAHPRIAGLPSHVARQAMVVRRAERIDVECVVRAYLTGSALAEYRRSGTIFGLPAPSGLTDGDRLPELMFTPTTKAETGHDEPMSMAEVEAMTGAETARRLRDASFAVFQWAHDHARDMGIIIADTKFEFGWVDGELTLIDEVLTPDSSRFWDTEGYAPGKSQPNFDKQFVRDWLIEAGWNREPPAPALPDDVVAKTRERYLEAYRRLVGEPLA